MRHRGAVAVTSNPVLVGAVTMLVVIVAVFLAYNANRGLPFVPTYELRVDLPNAAQLVAGNDVRVGGHRVGVVERIEAVRTRDGASHARLLLKLEKSMEPLPRDSAILVRPRSALGLKYVEITPGRSRSGYEAGAIVPVANATPEPVEFDDVLNTFDAETRQAMRTAQLEAGNALAGRGPDLQRAIADLPALLAQVTPVMEVLAGQEARLGRLFAELGDAAGEVAPVAGQQASLFVGLDRTFRALASVSRPYLQELIEEAPEAIAAITRDLPPQRPFLRHSETLFRELGPGVRALSGAARPLADALQVGQPVLVRSRGLSRRLKPTFRALERFATDPFVPLGVHRLTELARILNPTVAFLEPTQTVCNYVTLWFRNVASLLSEGDANGTWQRFIIIAAPNGPNSEGTPAARPADGPTQDNHLHANPYPNTAAPGQPFECEAGNEPYAGGETVIGNTPGTQRAETEQTKPIRDRTP